MSASVIAAQLADLAEHAKMLGVDEMTISKASETLIAQLAAMPAAEYRKQPFYSTSESVWRILETVRFKHAGIYFVAHRSTMATADQLAAARKLWSVP